MKKLMIFPRADDFLRAKAVLDQANLQYDVIKPPEACLNVGVPALALEQEVLSYLSANAYHDFICSGFVDDRTPANDLDALDPMDFPDDIFGKAVIVSLMPCIADETKIRLIVHLTNNIADVFPYLNAQMAGASYVKDAGLLTFMENHRLITLYDKRISIAKADDIKDAWRLLEKIRRLVNATWQKRDVIIPSYAMRRKPPALEIYYRLPKINCGKCGFQTCMAFALTLWGGNARPTLCTPVFEGEYSNLKDAFIEICAGLDLSIS